MYYIVYSQQNYIVLDSDPEYAHGFDTNRYSENIEDI